MSLPNIAFFPKTLNLTENLSGKRQMSANAKVFVPSGLVSNALLRTPTEDHTLSAFDLPHLAKIAWEHAKPGMVNQDLMKNIAEKVKECIVKGAGQQDSDTFLPNLSIIAEAYAVSGIFDKKLMKSIAKVVNKNLNGFAPDKGVTPHVLTNITWAFAKINYLEKLDMTRVMRCFGRMVKLQPMDLSQWAQIRQEKSNQVLFWPVWLVRSLEEFQIQTMSAGDDKASCCQIE
jgi:hypothetical protein